MKYSTAALYLGCVIGVVFAVPVTGGAEPSSTGRPSPQLPVVSHAFVSIDAERQNTELGRGMNVLGFDPIWRDSAKARFSPRLFKVIHDAGFRNVRIALESFAYMDEQNRLSSRWLETLDTMVKAALDSGLTVIVEENDFRFCGMDATECGKKIDAFWSQIAPRYNAMPNRVVFEILNEPHQAMTPELWNKQLRETLAIIRVTNTTRNVIIGPASWNNFSKLSSLDLPANDRHIIATFHYYRPTRFTHQGASWNTEAKNLSGVKWGTAAEYALLNKEFDEVKEWATTHDRPVFLGEFGTFDTAPMADRVRWTSAVARAAEARGFSWSYWQFDINFKAFDIEKDAWVRPILNALIPEKR